MGICAPREDNRICAPALYIYMYTNGSALQLQHNKTFVFYNEIRVYYKGRDKKTRNSNKFINTLSIYKYYINILCCVWSTGTYYIF